MLSGIRRALASSILWPPAKASPSSRPKTVASNRVLIKPVASITVRQRFDRLDNDINQKKTPVKVGDQADDREASSCLLWARRDPAIVGSGKRDKRQACCYWANRRPRRGRSCGRQPGSPVRPDRHRHRGSHKARTDQHGPVGDGTQRKARASLVGERNEATAALRKMRRRDFITLIGSATAARRLAARGQQAAPTDSAS
jgi:hypothetical protein